MYYIYAQSFLIFRPSENDFTQIDEAAQEKNNALALSSFAKRIDDSRQIIKAPDSFGTVESLPKTGNEH